MKRSAKKGFTLIELLIVISIIGILAGMGVASYGPVMDQVRRFQCQGNLRDMHKSFLMYIMDYNIYPTTQPPLTRYEKGGGVRDLWPLYDTGKISHEQLESLKCPQATLIPFSKSPTIDEFDRRHIGYSYNSTAVPSDPNNPPVMADKGVSSGVLDYNSKDLGLKPNHRGGANVLFANGKVKWINSDKNGKLSRADVSEEMWGRLLD